MMNRSYLPFESARVYQDRGMAKWMGFFLSEHSSSLWAEKNKEDISISLSAEWADKKGILKRWDGLNQYTLNRWIKEMRENRTFSMYVINPTHKLVFINLEGFESFLRWKQKRTK